jgi:hypothetical protein
MDDAVGFQKGAAIGGRQQNGQPNEGAVQYVEKKQGQPDMGGVQQPAAEVDTAPSLNTAAKPFVMAQQPAANLNGGASAGQTAGGGPGADEDLGDTFLQSQAENTASLPFQAPQDGEFSSFPEIHKKTVTNL